MRSVALLLLAGCASAPTATPAPPPAKTEAVEAPRVVVAGTPREVEAQGWYEVALAWHNKGDFEKAKISAQKAVQANPEHLAARKLLSEIHSILVGGPAVPLIVDDARVRDEQSRLEIAKHLRDGGRFLKAEMYEKARKEFEAAELKIRAMPYDVESKPLLDEARAGLASSKR